MQYVTHSKVLQELPSPEQRVSPCLPVYSLQSENAALAHVSPASDSNTWTERMVVTNPSEDQEEWDTDAGYGYKMLWIQRIFKLTKKHTVLVTYGTRWTS